MHGSLALHQGVLYVGRWEKTAHVRAFDLDGRPLGPAFSFRDAELGRSAAAGIAVDPDHRIWVADAPARTLRAFSVVGTELFRLAEPPPAGEGGTSADRPPQVDARGRIGEPVDVAVSPLNEEPVLVVGSRGTRRHALQRFGVEGKWIDSLRPLGDPQERFRRVAGVAARGRRIYACELGAERVQVFRDGEFHFAFRVVAPGEGALVPAAAAALDDGRVVVACGGERSALCLMDEGGALVRVLAGHGGEEGEVFQPSDVVADDVGSDRRSRVAVIDCDGDRVQVFSLDGRCFGRFESLAG